jgi:hypothetical protein
LTAYQKGSIITLTITTTGTEMKTNRELNTEYDTKMKERIRPKQPEFNWKPLEEVIRQWVTKNEQT